MRKISKKLLFPPRVIFCRNAEQSNGHFLNDFSTVNKLLGKGSSGKVVQGAVVDVVGNYGGLL